MNAKDQFYQLQCEEEDPKEPDNLAVRLLKTRTIIISGTINQKTSDKAIQQIILLEMDSPEEEIKVLINSPGGEVTSGFAIYDILTFVSCPITTIVTGLAASMASIISLAGDENRKFALPNSELMIHQPLLSGMTGQVTDLEIQAKGIQKTKEKIAAIYQAKTGKTIKQILKDIDRNFWLDADQAVEYGLIDKVISSRKEV